MIFRSSCNYSRILNMSVSYISAVYSRSRSFGVKTSLSPPPSLISYPDGENPSATSAQTLLFRRMRFPLKRGEARPTWTPDTQTPLLLLPSSSLPPLLLLFFFSEKGQQVHQIILALAGGRLTNPRERTRPPLVNQGTPCSSPALCSVSPCKGHLLLLLLLLPVTPRLLQNILEPKVLRLGRKKIEDGGGNVVGHR